MPRIPAYNIPQVQPQGAPDVRMNPNAPAGAFGAGLGQGLMQAAGVLSDVQHQAQVEADTIRTEDEVNQLRGQINTLGWAQDGAFSRRGKDALNLTGEYLPKLDEYLRGREGALATDRQRLMFRQAAGRLRVEFEGQLNHHAAEQGNAYQHQVFVDGLTAENTNVGNAVRQDGSLDLGAFQNSLARVDFLTRAEAQRQGADQQGIDNLLLAAKSAQVSTALAGMLTRNNPRGAQAILEANRDNLLPATRADLETKITAGIRGANVNLAVDDVWSRLGPRADNAPVNLDTMEKDLRQKFANDAQGQQLALAAIKDRATAHDYSVRQREDATQGSIWQQVLAGKPLSAIRTMPEFTLGLDGTKQAELVAKIEAFRKRNEDDPAVQVERNLAFYNAIHDPAFPTLTDNAIRRLAPSLGPERTKDLLRELNDVRTDPNKWKALQVDQDQLKDRAWKAGLISDQANPLPSEKNLLSQLEYRIKLVKQASGKPWTLEATEKLMDAELEKVVTETHWYGNTEKRIFQVEGQVPAPFVQTLRAKAMQEGRREPTKAEIIKTWFAARDRGLVDENGNMK